MQNRKMDMFVKGFDVSLFCRDRFVTVTGVGLKVVPRYLLIKLE